MIQKLHILLDRVITKKNLVFLVNIQNILGIILIFSSPLPIPPKTSIGMLTGTSLFMVIFLFFLSRKHALAPQKTKKIDWLITALVSINAVSLIVSEYIFDFTSFRLLLSAAIQYTTIRLLNFSNKEKQHIIHMVGITTVVVAAISLFQIVFREQAVLVAKRFLFGEAAYSVAWDLNRGRGPQWGNIIISFPLFFASALLLYKKTKVIGNIYVWIGIFLVPLSFVVSNFRGLTLCFFAGVTFYSYILFRYKLLSTDIIKRIYFFGSIATVGGIILASIFFQYNLVDRFLLKERERDVTFSIGRLFLYQQAISAFSSSPVVGIGTGNYRYVVERPIRIHYFSVVNELGEKSVDETDRESVSSHSDMLTILAETGLLGLLTYLCINYMVVIHLATSLVQALKTREIEKVLFPLSFLTALLMFYLIGLFENVSPNGMVFVFFIYAASITWAPSPKAATKNTR